LRAGIRALLSNRGVVLACLLPVAPSTVRARAQILFLDYATAHPVIVAVRELHPEEDGRSDHDETDESSDGIARPAGVAARRRVRSVRHRYHQYIRRLSARSGLPTARPPFGRPCFTH